MRKHGRRSVKKNLLFSFLLLIAVTSVFAARQGTLDTAFGTGGIAVAQVPDFDPNGPRDIVVQSDGKIIVVGGSLTFWNGVISLARFNANGSPDTSFGSGGLVITELTNRHDDTNSIVLQPDGKIVVAGHVRRDLPGDMGWVLDVAVVRYLQNGTLDPSFGAAGVVITQTSNGVINDVALQSDGKILLGGVSGGPLLMRYNSDGSPDTTFHGDGVAASAGIFPTLVTAMELQPNGKIVLAGYSNAEAMLVRYNSDGTLDPGFDTDGIVQATVGNSAEIHEMMLQGDGKIVAVGGARVNFTNRTEIILLRLNPDGSRDTTFDGDGLVVTDTPDVAGTTGRFGDVGMDLVEQGGGRIVVAASSSRNPVPVFLLIRYRSNGSLDTTFDGDGMATHLTGGGNCIAFQSDGNLVVGGTSNTGSPRYDLAVSRFFMQPNRVSDFDGDALTDVSVFRPSNGVWYLNRSTAGPSGNTWGISTDKITPADYDGDGKTDVAVFRPSEGQWYVLNSATSSFSSVLWGISTDIPAPADYDADGKADIAIFRPSDGTWWLNRTTAGVFSTQFGQNGDLPAIGDYDGDGRADLAVFRPGNGVWYVRRSTGGDTGFAFGFGTDKISQADYDGDGKTDVAVYRASTGQWFIANSGSPTYPVHQFGAPTDIPVPGDYDGDGRADIAIFRPSDGNWWLQRTTGGVTVVPFGQNGDRPTQSAFGN